MKRILFTMLLAASLSAEAQTQTYETEFARPLNEVLTDIQNRFGVRLKYDIDTVGKVLSYADFRIRPYSVEESLTNVLAPFDYKFVKQKGNMYKLKAYEYPRRTDADGEKMLAYLPCRISHLKHFPDYTFAVLSIRPNRKENMR